MEKEIDAGNVKFKEKEYDFQAIVFRNLHYFVL